jgi:signal transduction histidine kinase
MSQKTATRVAWTVGIAAIFLIAGQVAFMYADRHVTPPPGSSDVINLAWNLPNVLNEFVNAAAAAIGILLVSRRPENRIGWLFLVTAFTLGLSGFAGAYGVHALWVDPGSLPAGDLAYWAAIWTGFIPLMALTVLLIEFPTGSPLTARWRVAERIVLGGWLVTISAFAVFSALNFSHPFNPRNSPKGVVGTVIFLLVLLVPVLGAIATSLAAVITRFRRATGDERLQLKWFVVGAAMVLTGILLGILWTNPAMIALQDATAIFWFASIAVAILKYRLYEIEVVINRAVVYGTLAVFITAVYLVLVIAAGSLTGYAYNPLLSAIAAAVVALAFQPVRQWARKLANRVVYGSRATPYEVLSNFAERIAGTYATDDVLPQMAQIVAEGTGAERTVVWLRLGDELRASASADGLPTTAVVPVEGNALPRTLDGDLALPVAQQGELLGAISVRMPRGESLTQSGERLITEVASQAGLVLRNARLVEDLRASRQRLVTAQDQERRRIERNIHDGAQQQIVALAMKANLAVSLIGKDAEKERDLINQVKQDATNALENLRALARGIYPPLLADKGLAAALEAQVRTSPVPVAIEETGIDRYPQEAEATVYFCCLEALQNVVKYAQASRAVVRLSAPDGHLVFLVEDDGIGFDREARSYGTGMQGMSDRLAALGGELRVKSTPGSGTIVEGRLPVPPSESRPDSEAVLHGVP